MKTLLTSLFLIMSILVAQVAINACAMGGKPVQERAENDKLWRACSASQVKENRIGKLCNNTCVKKKHNEKCKEWKLTVKDFSKEGDFAFFENGNFIFIKQDSVL